jgi:hypothetical protein
LSRDSHGDSHGDSHFIAIGSAWLGSTRLIDNVPLVVPAVPSGVVLHESVSS